MMREQKHRRGGPPKTPEMVNYRSQWKINHRETIYRSLLLPSSLECSSVRVPASPLFAINNTSDRQAPSRTRF